MEFKGDDLHTQDLATELVVFLKAVRYCLVSKTEQSPAIVPVFEVVRGVRSGSDVAIVRAIRGYGVHPLWHNNSSRH